MAEIRLFWFRFSIELIRSLEQSDIFYHILPSNVMILVSIFFMVYLESRPLKGEIPDNKMWRRTPVDQISHFYE